jgi:hypothetical protein
MNDQVDPEALSDLLDGITERVSPGDEWGTGFVWTGDIEKAGTAEHRGEEMSREKYERRLEEYRKKHGPLDSDEPETIVIEVVEADSEPFEQKRYGPEEERDASRLY